jgi:integron integrase
MSKLLDHARDLMRTRHLSIRMEEAYLAWIKQYILFHHKQHPAALGVKDVTSFLSYLAVERHVSASTQNQALSAILFLYREVLEQEIDWITDAVRAQKPKRLPVVFTKEEAQAVLVRLSDTPWLMASLLYGSGLRLMECVRLRVQDLDFGSLQINVRDGKGGKDRVTVLPSSLVESLNRHLARTKALHERDKEEGFGSVYLPFALARKYPQAERDWI